MGDGTTSVVILAAELLKRANELVRNQIHPTNIISGYRLAMREVRMGRSLCHASRERAPCNPCIGLGTVSSLRSECSLHCMSCHSMPQSCKFIEEHMAIKVEKLGKETLINCAKTAMSSKVCALPAAGMRCQHITGLGIK